MKQLLLYTTLLFTLLSLGQSCCLPKTTKCILSTNTNFRIIKREERKIGVEMIKINEDLFINTDTLFISRKVQKLALKNKVKNAKEFCLLIKPGTISESYILEVNHTKVCIRNINSISIKGKYYRSNLYNYCKNLFKRKMKIKL